MITSRNLVRSTAPLALLAVLAACSSTNQSARFAPQPQQVNPVLDSSVQTTSLPPIGSVSQDASLTGTSYQTTDATGAPIATQGRDLSGGVSAASLSGGWTVISGANQCSINLTQTQSSGTSRSRASAPGCTISGLAGLASWQISGSQVQFYDAGGTMIGAVLQSGNRFIGTLSGGVGISMIG